MALVVVLYVLILSISHGEHYAPQAYYRSKRVGAPVALGVDRLGPRARKRLPGEPEQVPPHEPR
ncbi:MAG: hypothetical protein ACYDCQ_13070 [Dehalococcoidia bacterium]